MITVFYTGIEHANETLKENLPPDQFLLVPLPDNFESRLPESQLVVIGNAYSNPVKLVQQIYAADKFISTIILTNPENFAKTKQTILFAPFVGKNTTCVSYSPGFNVRPAFESAIWKTRQKRSFSQINKIPVADTNLRTRQLQVHDIGIFLQSAPIGAVLVNQQEQVIALNNRATQILKTIDQKSYLLRDIMPNVSVHELKLQPSKGSVIMLGEKYLELNLSEVTQADGSRISVILFNDITKQKKKEEQLKESEALFRFMAEAMPQKIWTADENGYRNYFNNRWVEYTAIPLADLLGWGWTEAIHPDDKGNTIRLWQHAVESGKTFEIENRLKRKDGEYRWHLVRAIPRKDAQGKVLMWIGTNTDIHEHKAFTEELEQRVKERTIELERLNSELEQFVYITSHDLQEPVRKIRIFSSLLAGSSDEWSDAALRHLGKIDETADRMSRLLRELLNFTHMSKEEQLEETDLNKIVANVMVDLELVIAQKSAVIKVSELPTIMAVPVQMHQLFYNLMSNALKFSKKEETPQITITAESVIPAEVEEFKSLQSDRSYHHIIVADNGIGFNQQHASQIFHIFQRLHTRAQYSGTGIGLALCKKVVLNHLGHIYAQSQPGIGSKFHILLPVQIT